MRYLWRADMNDGPANEQLQNFSSAQIQFERLPKSQLFVLRFENVRAYRRALQRKRYEDKDGGRCEITYLKT